ncbi:MAG: carbohydrate-binding family 9-like protein, partial [Spirochaetales bacterium]|nr:carbohydrate-binding family 9-like protein [Spirochaetales bacterium]
SVVPEAVIDYCQWGYWADVSAKAQICYDTKYIHVRLSARESNMRAEEHGQTGMPCSDSCLEFFFCPCPDTSDAYLNFEINPLGSLYVGFSHDGKRSSSAAVDFSKYKDLMDIKVVREEEKWCAEYKIPYDFIKVFAPDFKGITQKYITGNFYKCGDNTLFPHYAVWKHIDTDIVKEPDFHRVEFFEKINVFNNETC